MFSVEAILVVETKGMRVLDEIAAISRLHLPLGLCYSNPPDLTSPPHVSILIQTMPLRSSIVCLHKTA